MEAHSAPLPPVLDQPDASGSGSAYRIAAAILLGAFAGLAILVAFADMDDEEEAHGYVMPSPYVPVEHRGKRIVEQVHFREGDRVEKGEILYSTPGEEGLYTVKVRIHSVPPEIELRPRSRTRADIAIERDLPVWRVLARRFGIAERQLMTKKPRKRQEAKGDLLARRRDF